MLTLDSLRAEIEKLLTDVPTKKHLSVRWEPAPGICRVGVAVQDYTWETRDAVIDRPEEFEQAHYAAINREPQPA